MFLAILTVAATIAVCIPILTRTIAKRMVQWYAGNPKPLTLELKPAPLKLNPKLYKCQTLNPINPVKQQASET